MKRRSKKSELPTDLFANVNACIVDDNAVNRKILLEQFSSWGLRASAYDSGMEALAAIQEYGESTDNAFGIVIVDYHMPGMNGAEFAARLNEIQ